MRPPRLAVALVLAVLAGLAVAAMLSPREPPLLLEHWDSQPEGDGYREVFQVAKMRVGPVTTQNLTVSVDGRAVTAAWTPAGPLAAGARMEFQYPASDLEHSLRLMQAGRTLASLCFGSGAGTPVHRPAEPCNTSAPSP